MLTKLVVEQNGRNYSDTIYYLNDQKYYVQYYSDTVSLKPTDFVAVKKRSGKDVIVRFVFQEEPSLHLFAVDTINAEGTWARHYSNDRCSFDLTYKTIEDFIQIGKIDESCLTKYRTEYRLWPDSPGLRWEAK